MNERQTVDEILELEGEWSNGSIMLYHITSEENVNAIMMQGVRPDLSRGKMSAAWYVNKRGIVWAIAHVSLRHDLSVANLVVMTSMLPRKVVRKSGIAHMFYTKSCFIPEAWSPAEFLLGLPEGENE